MQKNLAHPKSLKMRLYWDRTMKSAKFWMNKSFNSPRKRQKRSHSNLKTNDKSPLNHSLWCLLYPTRDLMNIWWPTPSTRFQSIRRLTILNSSSSKLIPNSNLTNLIIMIFEWWSQLKAAHCTKTFKSSPAAEASNLPPQKHRQRSSKARMRWCYQLISR